MSAGVRTAVRGVRRLLLQGAGAVGAPALAARSAWRGRRLAILCYHGISLADEHAWNPELYMPAALFRARMQRLRAARYRVLPLGEAVARLSAGELPPRSVAVTFDDGFYDFFACALPVLREFDIPATNYVSTFYSQFPRPVFEPAVAYLLWKARARATLRLDDVIGCRARVSVRAATERAQVWHAIRDHTRRERLSADEKDALLARLAGALGIEYDAWVATRMLQLMRASEFRALPSELVDVQLHTHRHRMPDDWGRFAREIADNRAALAALLGREAPRVHFCYPSGAYTLASVRWLDALGVQSATTTDAGIAAAADHPLLLPRFVDTTLQPVAVFDAWVSGLYPALWQGPRRHRERDVRRHARWHLPAGPLGPALVPSELVSAGAGLSGAPAREAHARGTPALRGRSLLARVRRLGAGRVPLLAPAARPVWLAMAAVAALAVGLVPHGPAAETAAGQPVSDVSGIHSAAVEALGLDDPRARWLDETRAPSADALSRAIGLGGWQ